MSCRIISRKVEDGQLIGYLLEQEGLRFIVELRDLYEQEILESLIDSGYQYHDYYGDITTNDGVSINELASEPVTPEDNLSFKGAFGQQALTEQQALRYFRTNMSNITQISFREPFKILIRNREELVKYLKQWKYASNSRVVGDVMYPLNAICAKEALFKPEEVETDSEIREMFNWIANRRRYPTYESIRQLQDFFISEGLMTEEERDNIDSFVKSYSAWGPEGLNAVCIGTKLEYDVIYPIGVPYTGTGREKLTFESVRAALRADIKDDILNQINYRLSLGIMDKEGYIYVEDSKVGREDVIEHTGDIILNPEMTKKYNELSRSTGKWETQYRALQVINVIHENRLCMTLQTEDGRLYEWRMDKNYIALVSTNSSIYLNPTATVMSVDGKTVRINRLYGKDGYAKYTMFHRIAEEVIDARRVRPAYRSTSELCLSNGLHAEQALDYIQYMSGKAEATSILHYGVDELFMRKFGYGVDDLGEDADFIDVLELLQNNYNDAMTAEGPQHYDYSEVLSNILDGSIPDDDKKLAMYISNNHPEEKIGAILDFNSDKIALEQAYGRSVDNSNSNEESVYNGLMGLYKLIFGEEVESNKIGTFVNDVMAEKYIKLDDLVTDLKSEAYGCLVDYAKLKYKQLIEITNSIWVTGVIGEYSAAPIHERRHLGFVGVKMNLAKGSRMRKMVDALIKSVEQQMYNSGLYAEKDRLNYGRVIASNILDFLWAIKIGNINLDESNGMVSKTYTQTTKYGTKVSCKLEIGDSDYYYIKSPNCSDFSYAMSPLATYCKNSLTAVSSTLRFDSALMNVNVSPWRVSKRKGYNDVPVYNGCLNLITNYQWENFFKTNLPAVYNGVMSVGGRLDVNPYDFDNNYAIYPDDGIDNATANMLFLQVNTENGRAGSNLPPEYNNYYLESDKDESFSRYMQRIDNISDKLVNEGNGERKIYRVPLKADYYYKNIASYYEEDPLVEFETVPSSDERKTSLPYAPVYTETFAANLIGSDKAAINVTPVANADINVNKLLRCNSLVNKGFAPRFDCYVGTGNIFVFDKDKSTIHLDTTTVDDLIRYASVGLCYQLSTSEFLFYGVNGTFVLEVA